MDDSIGRALMAPGYLYRHEVIAQTLDDLTACLDDVNLRAAILESLWDTTIDAEELHADLVEAP